MSNDFELIYGEGINQRSSFDKDLLYPFQNPFQNEELLTKFEENPDNEIQISIKP